MRRRLRRRANSGSLLSHLAAITNLARLQALQGRLRQAAATYAEAAQLAPDGPQPLLNSAAYVVGLGDLHREWNELDAAEQYLMQGLDLVRGTLSSDADVVTQGYVALARLQTARGESAGAHTTLERLAQLAGQRTFTPDLAARGAAAQARLALAAGDLQAASRWAETCGLSADDALLPFPREPAYLTLTRVLLARAQRETTSTARDDALRLLDRLQDAAETNGRISSLIEIVILRALALSRQGDCDSALCALERVLQLAAPEGYVRSFVDEGEPMAALLRNVQLHGGEPSYVQRLLAAFPSRASVDQATSGVARFGAPSATLVEPLTERELEILRLIAAGSFQSGDRRPSRGRGQHGQEAYQQSCTANSRSRAGPRPSCGRVSWTSCNHPPHPQLAGPATDGAGVYRSAGLHPPPWCPHAKIHPHCTFG